MKPAMDLLATPTVKGLDRLEDLDGRPVVFAANHHSHVDTPLMLSVIPEPWRHHLFIGAAADYFFGNRVTVHALGAGHRRHPDRAHQGHPQLRRPGRRAARRRLEHADLPRGRALPRRVGPGLPRRRRLPVAALRGAGRARARRGHRPGAAQGQERAPALPHHRHLRHAAHARSRARTPASWPPASSSPSPGWPTRPPPTGGRPSAVPPQARRRRCRGPTTARGDAPGPSATARPAAAAPSAPGPSCSSALHPDHLPLLARQRTTESVASRLHRREAARSRGAGPTNR